MTIWRILAPALLLLIALVACGSDSTATLAPTPTSASNNPTSTGESSPTATPSPDAAVISLEAEASAIAPGQEFDLTVRLDPKGRGISGAQFDLIYPVASAGIMDIAPGSLMGDDPVEVEQTESETGAFTYAVARKGETQAPTPAGPVVIIKLRVLEDVSAGASLQLRLDNVIISNEEIDQLEDIEVSPPINLVVSES